MMHPDRALPASGSSTDAAAIAVSSEHLLPQTAEIFLILPLERVARGTHAQRENFPSSATTVKCPLNPDPNVLHFSLSQAVEKRPIFDPLRDFSICIAEDHFSELSKRLKLPTIDVG